MFLKPVDKLAQWKTMILTRQSLQPTKDAAVRFSSLMVIIAFIQKRQLDG